MEQGMGERQHRGDEQMGECMEKRGKWYKDEGWGGRIDRDGRNGDKGEEGWREVGGIATWGRKDGQRRVEEWKEMELRIEREEDGKMSRKGGQI